MNKLAMLLAVSFAIPVSVAAQDDMYFVPSESADAPVSEVAEEPAPTYYIGSQRDVDEYNRQGTYVQQIDSAGNDIIDFDGTVGVYPDSLRDYECTRQMSRFDDYSWFEPYWAAGTRGGGTIRGITVTGIRRGIIPDGIITRGITIVGTRITTTGMPAHITGLTAESPARQTTDMSAGADVCREATASGATGATAATL